MSKRTFVKLGGKLPSDLQHLRNWAKRLGAYLEEDRPIGKLEWMIYRPDRLAWAAMIALSVQYPLPMKSIHDLVDHADKHQERIAEGADAEEDLWHAMYHLNDTVAAAIKAIEKDQATPKQGDRLPAENAPTHASDFVSVHWFGKRHSFTKGNQAESVRLLWEAWEVGGHSLSQETIRDKIRSIAEPFQLAKVFRHRKNSGGYEQHEAWGTMIKPDSKGCYRLVAPESS